MAEEQKPLDQFEIEKQELEQEYKNKMLPSQWAEVAETLGQALTKFGAAQSGLKSGVDLSKVDMQKTDWEKPRSRYAEEYLTKLKLLYDKKAQESRAAQEVEQEKMRQAGRAKETSVGDAEKLAEQKKQNAIKNQDAVIKASQNRKEEIARIIGQDPKKVDATSKAAALGFKKEDVGEKGSLWWKGLDEDKLKDMAAELQAKEDEKIRNAELRKLQIEGGVTPQATPQATPKPQEKKAPASVGAALQNVLNKNK
jgi:hypothetical protein